LEGCLARLTQDLGSRDESPGGPGFKSPRPHHDVFLHAQIQGILYTISEEAMDLALFFLEKNNY
ncbi:MAG: hypothetical protein QW726_04860, partial [Fervidicoccaceae archaeon]